EILDAEADAIETDVAQQAQAVAVDGARIDLDRVLAVGRPVEVAIDQPEQALELLVEHEGGRAAAEMQVRDVLARTEQAADQPQFGVERIEVLRRGFLVARADLVAGTVVADAPAEGDMEVKPERTAPAPCALDDRIAVVGRPEAGMEAVRARIRGIAWRASAEALDQPRVDLDFASAQAEPCVHRAGGPGRRAGVTGWRCLDAGCRGAVRLGPGCMGYF